MEEKRIDVRAGSDFLGSLMLMENWNPPQVQFMHSWETLSPYLPRDFKTVHATMQEAVAYVQGLLPGRIYEHEDGSLTIYLGTT